MKPIDVIENGKKEMENSVFQLFEKQLIEIVDAYQSKTGDEVRNIRLSFPKVKQSDGSYKTEMIFAASYERS